MSAGVVTHPESTKGILLLRNTLLTGLSLLALSYWLEYLLEHEPLATPSPATHTFLQLGAKGSEHIGFAFLVAAAVAYWFDKVYHHKMFIKPLKGVQIRVEEATDSIVQATNDTVQATDDAVRATRELMDATVTMAQTSDAFKTEMVNFISILSAAEAQGIVDIYQKGDPKLKSAIALAIREAEQYLYIQGQSFQKLLVEDSLSPIGIAEIYERLETKPELDVKICLSDTYALDSEARKTMDSHEESVCRASIRELYLHLDKLKEHRICMRLTPTHPMHGILLTEEYLFLEHYTPSKSNQPMLVIKALSNASLAKLYGSKGLFHKKLHEVYKNTFLETFYNSGIKCGSTISTYIIRKQEAQGTQADTKGTFTKSIAEAKSYEDIAKRWDENEEKYKITSQA